MMVNKLIILFGTFFYTAYFWCLKTTFSGTSQVNSIDFSPDGQYILTGHKSGTLLLWNSKTLEIVDSYDFGNQIYEAVFSKDQNHIAVGGQSTKVKILDPTDLNNSPVTINADHDGKVFDLDFDYDTNILMTCGDDDNAKYWKTSNWGANNIPENELHHEVYTCQFGDDGMKLGAGDHFADARAAAYNNGNGNRYYQIHDKDTYDNFIAARIRPGSQYAILSTDNGILVEIERSNENKKFFTQFSGDINALGYSRDATYFGAAGTDRNVYFYNATNRANTVQSIFRTESPSDFHSARFSYDSNYFAVGNQDGTIFYFHRFCYGCPVGTYRNQNECTLCNQAMVGCAVCKNGTKCIGCYGGYYLNGDTCSSCSVIEGCAVCNTSANCTQCLPGYFLNGLVCDKCLDNHPGCYQCLNAATCLECDFKFYLDNTGTCISCLTISHCIFCNTSNYCLDCIVGYYEDSGNCLSCSTNCKSCQQNNNCTQCIGGYYSDSGICKKCTQENCLFCNNTDYCFDCEQDYYPNTGVCEPCLHPCSSCNDTNYCHSCVAGYYISSPGSCINCPSGCLSCNTSAYCHSCYIGYFLDTGSNTCKGCSQLDSNCRQCNSTVCLQCLPEFFYDSTNCVQCNSQIDNCQICTNSSQCQLCFTGTYLESDGSCSSCEAGCQSCKSTTQCSVCEPGYYEDSEDCILCTNDCLTCTDATTCLSCHQGMYKSSNSCFLCSVPVSNCLVCHDASNCIQCRIGYYLATPTTCTSCNSPCTTCSTGAGICTSCEIGYYLSSGSCLKCSSQCTQCTSSATNCQACIITHYLDTVNSKCLKCSISGCQICQDSTECLECQNGFYESSGDCYHCSNLISNCQRCDSVNNKCSLCDYGYTLISLNTACQECSVSLPYCEHCASLSNCETCMPKYYADTNGDCQPCSSGCLTCADATNCQKCMDKYIHDGGYCYLCETEMIGCKRCSSRTDCIQCVDGYHLNGNKCKLCRDSMEGCEICTDMNTCELCSVFYLIQTNNKCKLCSEATTGCQICDDSLDYNGQQGCLECQIGYYLSSSNCIACGTIQPGCLKCDGPTCVQCKAGYYLSALNKCIQCENDYPDCIYCDQNVCLQCQSGFYLSSGLCAPCIDEGCQICTSGSPLACLTCNSNYYLSSSQCLKCGLAMNNCVQCATDSVCTQCMNSYHVDSNNECTSCSQTFPGCSICTASGCQDCISNYFVNQSMAIPECQPCFNYIPGCAYCVSETVCLACQNGFYYNTSICVSCIEIEGCLYCENETECIHCEEGYYLENFQCFLCGQSVPGCYACDEKQICTSCAGHFELIGGKCVQIEGEVKHDYFELQLASQYVDDDNLKHTLFSRGANYQRIDHDWEKQVELTIINSNYTKIKLQIKEVKWGEDLRSLIFITNNPIGKQLQDSLSDMPFIKQQTNKRLLNAIDLNYEFKLFMTEQVIQDILPSLEHIGDLYMDHPLSEPQFYKSFIERKSYMYYLIGVSITSLLLIIYLIKIICLVPATYNKGEIIPHVMAIRIGALALYPTYPEYINFCYGFMTTDLPWFNDFFGSVLSNQSDILPQPFQMYYISLSMGSTYVLALIAIVVVWSCLSLFKYLCTETNKNLETKIQSLKSLLYNFFIFGGAMNGCLSLQGAIMNPITELSVSSIFYILGIIIYTGILFQLFHSIFCEQITSDKQKSINQESMFIQMQSSQGSEETLKSTLASRKITVNKDKIYKFRVFFKATALSLLHLNPLYLFICLFFTETFLLSIEHLIARTTRNSPKIETLSHVLANLAIAINLFIPDAIIGLVTVSLFAIIAVFLDIYCIYFEYCEQSEIDRLKLSDSEEKKSFTVSNDPQQEPIELKKEFKQEPLNLHRRTKKILNTKKIENTSKKTRKSQQPTNQAENADTFVFADL